LAEYAVRGYDINFGGYAAGNFTESRVSVQLSGTGRYFPEWRSSLNLQFTPNYFGAIPPTYMDTSALVAGSLFGMYSKNPFETTTFNAVVNSVSLVPIPSAALLFGSALLGLFGLRASRRLKTSVHRS
jgi:hypothetical protein